MDNATMQKIIDLQTEITKRFVLHAAKAGEKVQVLGVL